MGIKNENSIKQENMNRLWTLLRDVDRATVAQLAEWSGLSVVTTTALTRELAQLGPIEQDCVIQPHLGRPAVAYRFAAEFKLVLLIYMIESEQLDLAHFVVCDLHGNSIYSLRKVISDPSISSFDDSIDELIHMFPKICYIGIGLPVGSEQEGRLIASDYPSLQNSSLRTHIMDRFGLPTILENDINVAALGYCFNHQLEDQCVVSMFFPHKYTPGAGICLSGQIVKGRNGLAGACQHMPFGEDWQIYRDNAPKQCEIVLNIIRSTMCLLNPDVIVLYWDRPNPNIAELLYQNCTLETERILIPEIRISSQMERDFKVGLSHLTRNALFADMWS